ncbi:hypothetical protein TREMEDRAFT_61774 [Tremella mesenterica DSM 1558]|uniref:uncharacterized protein n=1 Tax=Tremella mesenterica (strain ATCC 24925 / CBS 8224 / DSM 1558 / NBRC 9311 / NRRL Y-6157 / RJB 2259-6 / UBC 559-6) TaxID=578456 RepID=UPI0003F4946D|nr:uncharacterized protein TREMEDRAFT_61774 [Tremella mesenterica DSM 1558]EIW70008.1 hypothetical protein TREMEDRAFT_61774 [Tremella mesenterica DSM 1558]
MQYQGGHKPPIRRQLLGDSSFATLTGIAEEFLECDGSQHTIDNILKRWKWEEKSQAGYSHQIFLTIDYGNWGMPASFSDHSGRKTLVPENITVQHVQMRVLGTSHLNTDWLFSLKGPDFHVLNVHQGPYFFKTSSVIAEYDPVTHITTTIDPASNPSHPVPITGQVTDWATGQVQSWKPPKYPPSILSYYTKYWGYKDDRRYVNGREFTGEVSWLYPMPPVPVMTQTSGATMTH